MKKVNKIELILSSLCILVKNKRIYFSLLFFCLNSMFSQQIESGRVEYVLKVNENFDVRKIFNSNPKLKRIDNSTKSALQDAMMEPANFVLLFYKNESLYKIATKEKAMEVDTKRRNFKKAFLRLYGGGDNLYYTNMAINQIIVQEQSIVLSKLYLISYNFSKWKLLNETKKIGNYVCYKAIRNDFKSDLETNKQTVVWYTPQIPVQFGPKFYNGLPGLVLEVDVGMRVFLATKIVLNPTKKISIKKPKKGIKITGAAYHQKIVEASKGNGF